MVILKRWEHKTLYQDEYRTAKDALAMVMSYVDWGESSPESIETNDGKLLFTRDELARASIDYAFRRDGDAERKRWQQWEVLAEQREAAGDL